MVYLFDAGVLQSLRPRGPYNRPEEIAGQALEGLVAQRLRAFREDDPESRALLLYRGEEELTLDPGIRALPVTTFLRSLRPGQEIN
jgi:hypothetical protein